jgi:hypothetical protein
MIYDLKNLEKFTIRKIQGQLLAATAYVHPEYDSLSDTLDKLFEKQDLTLSFKQPVYILYDETLTSVILISIHRWLRTKCADIENITLITTHHIGVAAWWKDWLHANHEKSFKIIELSCGYASFMNRERETFEISPPPTLEYVSSNKNIQHYFNLYGGTYPTNDKLYLILKSLELNEHGIIGYLGNFLSKQQLLKYAENITYYKNQKEVKNIECLYDQFVDDKKLIKGNKTIDTDHLPIKNEKFFTGYQYFCDNLCFISVVRETYNDQPFITVTEKTLRAFLHHLVVMPTGYQSVQLLEAQGFWFPHDLLNYDYQYEKNYAQRISKLIQSLHHVIKNFSIADLQNYYYKNLQKIHNNLFLVLQI